jgi:hypothetical protein
MLYNAKGVFPSSLTEAGEGNKNRTLREALDQSDSPLNPNSGVKTGESGFSRKLMATMPPYTIYKTCRRLVGNRERRTIILYPETTYSLINIRVYNINKGRNKDLLSRSESLAGYAEFVAQVRENQKAAMPLEEAVTGAVRRCVEQGILAPFLEEHGSEVMNMLLHEWDWDVAKEVWQEEAMEKGVEKAMEAAKAEYQPIILEKDREIAELRQKLREAGIDPRQN